MANEQNLILFKEGDPAGPGRPKGKRNRSTVARLLLEQNLDINKFPMQEPEREAVKGILTALGIDPDVNQAEVYLTIAAIIRGMQFDPKANGSYMALMDSGYGKPAQPIEYIEQEKETHDLSKLLPDELEEYVKLESRIQELLAKCSIEIIASEENSG